LSELGYGPQGGQDVFRLVAHLPQLPGLGPLVEFIQGRSFVLRKIEDQHFIENQVGEEGQPTLKDAQWAQASEGQLGCGQQNSSDEQLVSLIAEKINPQMDEGGDEEEKMAMV